MKKTIFTLLLCAAFGTALVAQKPNVSIKKATVSPVVDGEIEDAWTAAEPVGIDLPYREEAASVGSPGETTWQALYDDNGIYILLKVNDDVFFPAYAAGSSDTWEYDKPEIYFDVNEELADGKGAQHGLGHYQVAPGFVEGENDGTNVTDEDGTEHAFMVDDPTYIAEYFVPFSRLLDLDENPLDKTRKIGFDVTIIDRDDAENARQRNVWTNIGTFDESWSNMNECGTITLEGLYVSGVTAQSITISGKDGATSIDTDEGTLEMVATILPEDTDNKNVRWTVTNGTGTAFIGQDGVLRAMTAGTVTVTGTTRDGSDKSHSVEITLTHQSISMADLSLVKGGDFWADGNVDFPWVGAAFVSDGVAVCDPDGAGANPWDWVLRQVVDAENDVPYIFTFNAYADADRTFNVDFEDPNNNYTRYGVSTDAESNGTSDWTFTVTTLPKTYVFHVTFTEILENTIQSMQFMLGNADEAVYLDSVYLVAEEDLDKLTPLKVSNNKISNVSIYPNPVVDQLVVNITSTHSNVAIFNSLGHKMDEAYVKGNKATFDVSKYAKGLYFVKVNNDVVRKFIK